MSYTHLGKLFRVSCIDMPEPCRMAIVSNGRLILIGLLGEFPDPANLFGEMPDGLYHYGIRPFPIFRNVRSVVIEPRTVTIDHYLIRYERIS